MKSIVFYIPTLKGGGAEKVFVNLANHFAGKGIDTLLIFSYRGGYVDQVSGKVKIKYILKRRLFKNRFFK